MSTTQQSLIEVLCPGCGSLLRAPAESAGHLVACPQCGTNAAVPKDLADPLGSMAKVDEPLLGTPRTHLRRSSSSEMALLWGILGLIGVSLGGYAVYLATRPRPSVPTTVIEVHQAPGTALSQNASLEPRSRVIAAPAAPQQAQAPRRVVRVIEEPVGPQPRSEPVDPVDGFQTEEAFDNPIGRDGSYDRNGSQQFNRPIHGRLSNFENPPHDPDADPQMAPRPPADRPNVPDPSFENPR